jgi:hypothetical protein
MAQNMGFGSALTGFGSGYLSALKQGRAEQNSLLSAKLRKDALTQKKQESEAAGQLRALQMADMLDARAFRRKDSENKANYNNNRLLGTAQGKVTDFYTKMQPYLKAQTPDQRKTTHDSMRSSVRSMLVAGGMDPKLAGQQAEEMIKPYGAQLQDETVDINLGPNMTNEGLMSQGMVPQSSVNAQFGGNAPAPGKDSGWQMQPDGTWGRVGTQAIDKDARSYLGMQNYLGDMGNNMLRTALGGRDPKTGGFQQFQDPTVGVTEQRQGITKTVPATATYGMDELTRSQVGKNDASTKLTNVRTQQLVDLFPDQAAFLKKRVEALGAGIENTKTRTKFIGLNYDLELRKLAAQTAHQQAMESIGRMNADTGQQNLALRKIGLRLKAIIDPERIVVNTSAIIGDLERAKGVKGANIPLIDQQIARLQKEQRTMKEFSHIATSDPRKLSDMNYMAKIFAGQVGQMSPEMQADVARFGLSPSPYKMYDTMLGNSQYQSPFWDTEDWDNQDYMDNSESIPGWNGFAGAAAANPRPNPLMRNPLTMSNGGIPGFTF